MIGYRHTLLGSRFVNVGELKIMIVTDIHLKADVEDDPEAEGAINESLHRYYYSAPNLMDQFIADVNSENPDVVICLGDMCDLPEYFTRWNGLWDSINPGIKKYIVPGNHDLDELSFTELTEVLGYDADPVVAGSPFNKVIQLNDNVLLILCDVTFNYLDVHVNAYTSMSMHSTAPAWIESTLANYNQNTVIIAAHCAPAVAEFNQTQAAILFDIIDDATAARPDLNVTWICGHDHMEALRVDTTTHANSVTLTMPAMILYENGRYATMLANETISYTQQFLDYEFGDAVLPFIMRIDTTKGDGLSQFKFPFSTSAQIAHDMVVDWGDGLQSFVHGAASTLGTATLTHPYAAGGIYDISIYGKCESLYFNNGGDRLKPTRIMQWGHVKNKSMAASFYGCSNITLIPSGPITGCEANTTMYRAMRGMTSLAMGIPSDLLSLMPLLTSCLEMLYGNTGLTGTIPATLYSSNPLITTLSGSTRGCTGLTGQIPGSLHDELTVLTDASQEFYGCTGLTSIGTGLYDNNPSITTFAGTFQNDTGLSGSTIPSGLFLYCIAVTNYNATFSGCRDMAIGGALFNINELFRVTTWAAFMVATSATYSNTGTIQKVWDIADGGDVDYTVAPTVSTAFRNQNDLTNYADIPTAWKS